MVVAFQDFRETKKAHNEMRIGLAAATLIRTLRDYKSLAYNTIDQFEECTWILETSLLNS